MEEIEKSVLNEALRAIRYFSDDIIQKVMETQEAPLELTDYSDSYHQDRITLDWLPAIDAVRVIEALEKHEASPGTADWERDWREALAVVAQETYRNAVISKFGELMESLNVDFALATNRGEIRWGLPEPRYPSGVLDWDPDQEREMALFAEKQRRFQETAAPKIRKQLKKIVDAFIAKERV